MSFVKHIYTVYAKFTVYHVMMHRLYEVNFVKSSYYYRKCIVPNPAWKTELVFRPSLNPDDGYKVQNEREGKQHYYPLSELAEQSISTDLAVHKW